MTQADAHAAVTKHQPSPGPAPAARSEREAQGKLHKTRSGQRRKIFAELRRVVGKRRLSAAHVVAHRVGGVERLPTELQAPLFTQGKLLADAGINLEHAI